MTSPACQNKASPYVDTDLFIFTIPQSLRDRVSAVASVGDRRLPPAIIAPLYKGALESAILSPPCVKEGGTRSVTGGLFLNYTL